MNNDDNLKSFATNIGSARQSPAPGDSRAMVFDSLPPPTAKAKFSKNSISQGYTQFVPLIVSGAE